jgi:hypothetical protein
MRRIGSLDEWLHYLDAKSDDEAAAALVRYERQIDALYEDLSIVMVYLLDSPTGEVPDALGVGRSALAEAAGMLESVRARFDAGERRSA